MARCEAYITRAETGRVKADRLTYRARHQKQQFATTAGDQADSGREGPGPPLKSTCSFTFHCRLSVQTDVEAWSD